MNEQELIPHLFRTEYRKITAVLCKTFGMDHIEAAEDIASDTFLTAAETWGQKGLPANPTAWLYTVAKNKAKNYLRRTNLFNQVVLPVVSEYTSAYQEPELDMSEAHIRDSQLQMMFAICNPTIPVSAQIGLSLRILCGFGIEEIAEAFLVSKETINKRLQRAKEKLRAEQVLIELPCATEIPDRQDTVLTTLYLLFSEGYYATHASIMIRKDLCLEAMRLTHMLTENEITNTSQVCALLSLMCFHASRFDARTDKEGGYVLYEDQDTTLWNSELIERGNHYLNIAAKGNTLSKYHVEAAIAFWHTKSADTNEKWEHILQLYNKLLQLCYSPVAALNRTYALYKSRGRAEALQEALKLELADNRFYFVLLGTLYTTLDNVAAIASYQKAILLAKTPAERKVIQAKIDCLLL